MAAAELWLWLGLLLRLWLWLWLCWLLGPKNADFL